MTIDIKEAKAVLMNLQNVLAVTNPRWAGCIVEVVRTLGAAIEELEHGRSREASMTEQLGALRLENGRLQQQVKTITAGVQMALDGSSDDDPVRLAARRGKQFLDRRCDECAHWIKCGAGEKNGGCVKQGPTWLSNASDSQVFVEPWGGAGCDRYEKGTP